MPFIYTSSFKTPFGQLRLGEFQEKLCLADWQYRKQRELIDQRICDFYQASYKEEETALILKAKRQLEEYFNKERKEFKLELDFAGSVFQQIVWSNLRQIPYGTIITYKELANKMNKPKGIRAIANANGANAISIIIPCHRVIGSNGKLHGYAGGLKAKEKLLNLEGALTNSQFKLFD